MDEERLLRELASTARKDAPPLVDVRGRVLATIASSPGRQPWLLWAFTAVSSAAAAAVVAVAWHGAAAADPVVDLFQSVMAVSL
jgi:hypothetical protein